MQYRIVYTAMGWLRYAGGQQLGTCEGPGEVISAAHSRCRAVVTIRPARGRGSRMGAKPGTTRVP